MDSNLKYRLNIIWSDEDNCYLVGLPDFPGQEWRTQGNTYIEAFKQGIEVMEELHLAVVNGDIPKPEVTVIQSPQPGMMTKETLV